ncbi:uncharacterized protein LOC104425781 [Eucalyptus grandis]|uniref:uncharacterized protein LOC104425781 n=1 Tax=Eucalyptus grandis TaxID=71139 RepID=UPI00192E8B4F|nr:uncharacterized protein LOC104425781 [Eucalyptus grandis]
MALTTVHGGGGGGGRILPVAPSRARATTTTVPVRRLLFPISPRRTLHIASAKKLSPRTGKFDSRNRRGTTTTTTEDQQDGEDYVQGQGTAEIERVGPESSAMESSGVAGDDGYFLPDLPGDKPDFWEGPQWDAFGFFVQYLWAFGIGFALIACGIAVATYNQGATDFKDTPVYKESVQSRDLLEEPDANSDVFESNPTEVAPSLE